MRARAIEALALLALTGAASAAPCVPMSAGEQAWLRYYEAAFGLPRFLLAANVLAESGGCVNTPDSGAGAIGLGQLMPATAAGMRIDPRNPVHNLYGAARYLRAQWDAFRDWPRAIAAYNAGPANVRKYGGVPPFPETVEHVRKVLAKYQALTAGETARARAATSAKASAPPVARTAAVVAKPPAAQPPAKAPTIARATVAAVITPGGAVTTPGSSATGARTRIPASTPASTRATKPPTPTGTRAGEAPAPQVQVQAALAPAFVVHEQKLTSVPRAALRVFTARQAAGGQPPASEDAGKDASGGREDARRPVMP